MLPISEMLFMTLSVCMASSNCHQHHFYIISDDKSDATIVSTAREIFLDGLEVYNFARWVNEQ